MSQKKHGGGPKTPEGKQRSAMNALKHGFAAQTVVLSTEDPEEFKSVIDRYVRDFDPQDSREQDLVEELAVCRWRLQRAWSIETEMFEITMSRKFAEVAATHGTPMNKTRSALGFMSIADEYKAFSLLNRYETRVTRRFHQILAELKSLKNQRQTANCETNSSSSASHPPKSLHSHTNLAVVPKPAPEPAPGPGDPPAVSVDPHRKPKPSGTDS